MTDPGQQFFVTGGTLHFDAASYVVRQADSDLLNRLHQGEFCYVLNARQMGKSSIMVRTAARLRAEGVHVVVLDLTAVGKNVSVEQWYFGLLQDMAGQLDLLDVVVDYWRANKEAGPLKRWVGAIRQAVLPALAGRLVIFIDEIDAVRSLSFSTDEFFAGIRECYNRRAGDPEFQRISFCLLGVATPADLIRDVQTTPFNIGHRIELADFTEREAAVLAAGLAGEKRDGRKLLNRILYWTGGHPYLTQRLCRAVAEHPWIHNTRAIDVLCEELFLGRKARETDDNLTFVRNRLLMSSVDLASLLDLYRKIHARGSSISDVEKDPLASILKLSGVVRSESGFLRVRNRIYNRVFDEEWIRTNMPGAEVRRQRRAFGRGLAIAAGVGVLVITVLGAIMLPLYLSAIADAEKKTARANMQTVSNGLMAYEVRDENHLYPTAGLIALTVDLGRDFSAAAPDNAGPGTRSYTYFIATSDGSCADGNGKTAYYLATSDQPIPVIKSSNPDDGCFVPGVTPN